jgi:hypothetical protein
VYQGIFFQHCSYLLDSVGALLPKHLISGGTREHVAGDVPRLYRTASQAEVTITSNASLSWGLVDSAPLNTDMAGRPIQFRRSVTQWENWRASSSIFCSISSRVMSEGLAFDREENRSDDPGCIHKLLSRISLFFWLRARLRSVRDRTTVNKHWHLLGCMVVPPSCQLSAI